MAAGNNKEILDIVYSSVPFLYTLVIVNRSVLHTGMFEEGYGTASGGESWPQMMEFISE